MSSRRESSYGRKPWTVTAVSSEPESLVYLRPIVSASSVPYTNTERKKKNIFRKLTKRKRLDEKCESNPNTKPMLILTFAFCLIIMVTGGSVKMK